MPLYYRNPVQQSVVESQRAEHEIAHRRVVAAPGDPFDHPPQQGEGGVVVGEELSQWILLRSLRQNVGDVACDAVVVLAGIGPVVAVPAREVLEQVADRDPRGGVLVHDPQVGDIGAYRRVQIDGALVDEVPDRARGVGLRQGPDPEEGRCADRHEGVHARHAGGGVFLAVT